MARRRSRAQSRLAATFVDLHPVEASAVLEAASAQDAAQLLDEQGAERAADQLRRLSPDRASAALERMDGDRARGVLRALDPQRAVTLLARLEAERRETLLGALEPGLAQELRALAEYPPDTAGGLMDPRATAFRTDATVRDVVRRLRGLRSMRIQDVFVVDEEGRLVGSVPLQEVVLAASPTTLRELARSNEGVGATAPREEVLAELERQRAASLPVVDYAGRLLGVLRQDELITATQEEATAELVTMVGASREERALSPPLFAVRKRLGWLQINLLTAFLAASVVGIFEGTIARFTALAVLLPVVAGQSGNTGAQALAVTMRGLALREVWARHWLGVARKEIAAAALNGLAVALTTSIAVYIWSGSDGLALVIGISMVVSMTAAGLAGAVIPMMLTALGQDPAQSSSIILTTVTDVAGFFSFLGIATLLSGML